jgi:hypothetical protein
MIQMTDRVEITFVDCPDAPIRVTACRIYASEGCLVIELDKDNKVIQAHPLHTIKFFKVEHGINE